MKNLTLYLTSLLCLFFTEIFAQASFEQQAKDIATNIENITKDEKAALKSEIEAVNTRLDKSEIAGEEAETQKRTLAETHARNIETRVAAEQQKLNDLVQQKVDGKISEKEKGHEIAISFKHDKNKDRGSESRTTSQLLFSFGAHNLVTDNAVAHSDFRYWGSHYFEVGPMANTRILKSNNLLHLRYGVTLVYNTLRPTDNRIFAEFDDQTYLATSVIHQEDTHFRNTYITVPLNLEFDFSGSKTDGDKQVFQTMKAFRFGFGGYAGVNVNTKQILEFDDADGNDVERKTRGNYNVNDFLYGVSAYMGYRQASLYLKYDLSPLFEDNFVDQNGISLGIRWDWN